MKSSLLLSFVVSANLAFGASIIPIVDVTGHDTRNNFDGNINDMINGSGMNGNPQAGGPMPSDISLWTPTLNQYQAEWQSRSLLAGATNSKIGWTTFDLGSTTNGLDELHLWHIRESGGRVATSYNVYVASTPTVALPAQSPLAVKGDYDFASGGWTFVTSGTGSHLGSSVLDLGGASGRYIGVEILSNGGDSSRVGFAEAGVTAIPEPAAALLGSLGILGLLRRRRSA